MSNFRGLKKIMALLLVFFLVFFIDLSSSKFQKGAKAATTTFSVNWNTDFQGFAWVQTACTALATCTTGRVNDAGVSSNVLFASAATVVGGVHTGYWKRSLSWQAMGVPANATVTNVDGSIQAKLNNESTDQTQNINIFMLDGTDTTIITQSSAAIEPNSDVTPVGAWNTYNTVGNIGIQNAYQDYDTNVTIRLIESVNAGLGVVPSAEIRLHNLSLIITYEFPTLTQSNFRFFNNTNSADVGSALAAQNSSYTMSSNGEIFRLRQMIGATVGKLFVGHYNFKLQFVDKGTGTCSSPTGGTPSAYTDVTTSTSIAFYDNNTVADGVSLTSNINDPTAPSGSLTKFTYEESGNFTNSSNIPIGDFGLWDFSLYDNTADPGKSFCFRIVKSDGTPLDSYSQYAQINTEPATLTIDFVDGSGNSVASPSAQFASIVRQAFCQQSTAILGGSSQKLRVRNTTLNPNWTISIASSSGNTSLWSGTSNYDFNDSTSSGCADGSDTDSYGGLMTINPSTGVITPQSGCTNTGITLGSSASFNEGTLDSITLVTSGGTTPTECYWDFTNFSVDQTIPESVPVGNYSQTFIVTILAF